MANDIGCVIIARDFKIAMIRGQPSIHYLDDLYFIVGHPDEARRFLAPVSGIAVNLNLHHRSCAYSGCQKNDPLCKAGRAYTANSIESNPVAKIVPHSNSYLYFP